MRQIFIDGRIGKDAEVLTTNGGRKYVKFSLANNFYRNKETKTDWFEVVSYDDFVVEKLAPMLTKGKYIFVIGEFNIQVAFDRSGRPWINQDINAISIQFPNIGTKKEESSTEDSINNFAPAAQEMQKEKKVDAVPEVPSSSENSNGDDDDDELPF